MCSSFSYASRPIADTGTQGSIQGKFSKGVRSIRAKLTPIRNNIKGKIHDLPSDRETYNTVSMRILAAFSLLIALPCFAIDGWKTYENKNIGVQVDVKTDWTCSEYRDATGNGMVTITISKSPLPAVNVEITRQLLDMPYETWISTPILSQVFEPGFQKKKAVFGKRPSFRVYGQSKDGRHQATYYTKDGTYLRQVTFSAPYENWKHYEPDFDRIGTSLKWVNPSK